MGHTPKIARFGLILAAFCTGQALAADVPDSIIRVAVLENSQSFNLECDDPFSAIELETGRKTHYAGNRAFLVQSSPDGLTIEEDAYRSPVRIMSLGREKYLRVNGLRYRDTFLLRKGSKGGIHVINELGLDGYVNGILPREVTHTWPREALRAQAVVSRTYALRNLHRHDSEGYHLCAGVHCQVFGGLDSERKQTTQAVADTHNEIALYNGEPAGTFFFSNCGGRTEEPKNAWEGGSSLPYLKSRHCGFCRAGGHYQWEKEVSGETLAGALRKSGFDIGSPIRFVKVDAVSSSGRARSFLIRHEGGQTKVTSARFRMAAGVNLIRSTFIGKIKKTKDGFLFKGRGWGHGVGLCQEGARGMALKGKSYKKIVRFYYPGTKIKKFED